MENTKKHKLNLGFHSLFVGLSILSAIFDNPVINFHSTPPIRFLKDFMSCLVLGLS